MVQPEARQSFQLNDAETTVEDSEQTATRKGTLVFDIGILISGIMIVVSLLMPWFSHGLISTTGLDGLLNHKHTIFTLFQNPVLITNDSIFVGPVLPIIFGILIIVCSSILLARRGERILTITLIVLGILTTASATIDIVWMYVTFRPRIAENAPGTPNYSVGSGLWVLGIFGIAVVVFALLRIRAARRSSLKLHN